MIYKIYDLSVINKRNTLEILDDIKNETGNNLSLTYKKWMKNEKVYNILKYDKTMLSYDMIEDIGLWRSVVYSDRLNIFSPPKAFRLDEFMNRYSITDCGVEEFVEGTMINLFYDKGIDNWEIASKSSIGGNVTFFQDQPTFSELFNDICSDLDIDINKFSQEYSYSFVIQHPKNKFVIPIKEKRLYLIAMYKIDCDNLKVTEILPIHRCETDNPILSLDSDILTKLSFPSVYYYKYDISYSALIDEFGSMNTNIYVMGVVIHHINGARTKIRNPNYDYLKCLRGNNNKLQYQYLCLRKLKNIKEYLQYFPENHNKFNTYRRQIHLFTNSLYKNYISCYIKKEKPLKEFSPQFTTHMYNIHQHYLSIRDQNGYINKLIVINYVNQLESAKLMYTLNYHLHQIGKQIDANKIITDDTIETEN